MKIGILTFHRAHNYGAVLQCYALQETLRSMGHDVWVIDYKQKFIDSLYRARLNVKYVIKMLLKFQFKSLKNYLLEYYSVKRRSRFFQSFRKDFLHCTQECSASRIPNDFDCFIVGSDQVWGMHCTNGIDPVFWGQFERNHAKLIGYAISANGDYKDYLSKDKLVAYFKSFDDLTFREEKIREDFFSMTGERKQIALDPTLLTDQNVWQPLLNKKWNDRKYVVVYQIRRLEHNKSMLEDKAQKYAEKNGCEVFDLSNMTYSVCDFLSLIKNAECVFTSSFHATVFSVIFGTPFYSFKLNDGHDERYESLLNSLDLQNHLVDEYAEIEKSGVILNKQNVELKLQSLRIQSVEFLKVM